MQLSDLTTRLATSIMRDDLATQYTNFVNEALREIQRRRSWLVMTNVTTFTMPVNQNYFSLPSNFKELSTARTPVHLVGTYTTPGYPPYVLTPCEVWTRERVIRQEGQLLGYSVLNSIYRWQRISVPVYVEWAGGTPQLKTFWPVTQTLQFQVAWMGYFPDLVNPTDSNWFTIEFPELVVAKAKVIAFEAINDPAAMDFEQLYLARFKDAAAKDSYAATAGQDLRM